MIKKNYSLRYCSKCTINFVYEKKVIKLQKKKKSRVKKLFYIKFHGKNENFNGERKNFFFPVRLSKRDTKKCIEPNCLKKSKKREQLLLLLETVFSFYIYVKWKFHGTQKLA
jgi:hypothetical protein